MTDEERVRLPPNPLHLHMSAIDWVILALGLGTSVLIYFQRKAIKERDVARTESLGMALLLLYYLEVEARKAKDRPGNQIKL